MVLILFPNKKFSPQLNAYLYLSRPLFTFHLLRNTIPIGVRAAFLTILLPIISHTGSPITTVFLLHPISATWSKLNKTVLSRGIRRFRIIPGPTRINTQHHQTDNNHSHHYSLFHICYPLSYTQIFGFHSVAWRSLDLFCLPAKIQAHFGRLVKRYQDLLSCSGLGS